MIWIYLQILWKTANGQGAAVLQDSQPSKADFRWKKKSRKIYSISNSHIHKTTFFLQTWRNSKPAQSHILTRQDFFDCFQLNSVNWEFVWSCLYPRMHVWMCMRGSVPNHGTEHQCHVLEMLFPNCGLWDFWTHFSLYLSLRDTISLTSKAMFSFYVTYIFSLSCSFSANFCINSLVLFHSGSGKYLKEFLLTSWLLYAKI